MEPHQGMQLLAFWRRLAVHRRPAAIFVAAGFLCLLGYFNLPEPGSAAGYLALSALPILAIVTGARLHRPNDLRPWLMLAAGQAAFFLGDLIWYAEYLRAEVEPV